MREAGGSEALRVKKASGRLPKLSDKQKRALEKVLSAGPIKAGYRTDLWTTARVAEAVERRFGIG